MIPDGIGFDHRSAGTRHLIPDAERARSEQPVVNRMEQMATGPKEILLEAVHPQTSLRVGGGCEPVHASSSTRDTHRPRPVDTRQHATSPRYVPSSAAKPVPLCHSSAFGAEPGPGAGSKINQSRSF